MVETLQKKMTEEELAGFKSAEDYAKARIREEKNMKEYNTSGVPFHKMSAAEYGNFRNVAGYTKKIPLPPIEAAKWMTGGKHDPLQRPAFYDKEELNEYKQELSDTLETKARGGKVKKKKKSKKGYSKKYANGGTIRKPSRAK